MRSPSYSPILTIVSTWDHSVILCSTNLECDQEEQAVNQDTPNSNVRSNACWQGVCVHHDGSIPVKSDKCPGQWPRHNWDMDKARENLVAEVERGEIEKVENQHDLSPHEVATDEKHNERELQEVVEDEVASNSGGSVDIVCVGREQMPDIANLKDEEQDPKDHGQ